MRAGEALAPLPVGLGFLAIGGLARWLASRSGLTMVDLGWRRSIAVDLLLGIAVGSVLMTVNASALYPWLQALRPGFDPTLSSVGFPTAILAMAVLAEDTLYRGYLLLGLQRRFGRVAAVWISSLLYCLLAPGQRWPLSLFALILGLVLCTLRLWRNSLVVVSIVHAFVLLNSEGFAPSEDFGVE